MPPVIRSVGEDGADGKDNDLALVIGREGLVVVAIDDLGIVLAHGKGGLDRGQIDVVAVDHEDLVFEQGAHLVGAGQLLVPDADRAIDERLLLVDLGGVFGCAEGVHGDDARGSVAQKIMIYIADQHGRGIRWHRLRIANNCLRLQLLQLGHRAHIIGMIGDLRIERLQALDDALQKRIAHALLDEQRGHRVLRERIVQRGNHMVLGAVQIAIVAHYHQAGRVRLVRHLRLLILWLAGGGGVVVFGRGQLSELWRVSVSKVKRALPSTCTYRYFALLDAFQLVHHAVGDH